jgi:uncharacterized protein YhfF
MPPIPPNLQPFWSAFEARIGEDLSSRFYEAFHFGNTEALADDLGALVLSGVKRATACLLWAHEAEGKPLMKAGDLSVVTGWDGRPLCVIETTAVDILPFEAVDADFAFAEGEGDRSLRHWREVHWAYFARECQELGRAPDPAMPVLCERFKVRHPDPD